MHLLPLAEALRLLRHAQDAYPREAAGVLLGREWKGATWLSFVGTPHDGNTPASFRIRDAAIARIAAEHRGTGAAVCGCAHTHNVGPARPSPRDHASRKGPCRLWLIYSVPHRDLNLFSWDGTGFRREPLRLVAGPAAPALGPGPPAPRLCTPKPSCTR
jgi:proteasome lid subunit RPN8/RPN11